MYVSSNAMEIGQTKKFATIDPDKVEKMKVRKVVMSYQVQSKLTDFLRKSHR